MPQTAIEPMANLRTQLRPLIAKALGQYLNILAVFSPDAAARRAFLTFTKVRRGRVKPVQQEYLEAAKFSVEEIAGHKVQTYRWPGDGQRVLLVHGWESNTFRWRNLIRFLQEEGFDIMAFDAPGHGHSSGKYLNAFLYSECLDFLTRSFDPYAVIGHSMGGLTALYHAHRHPDGTAQKIVTIGSPSELQDILKHYQLLLGFNDRVLHALDAFFFSEFGYRARDFSTAEFARSITKKGLILHDHKDQIAPFLAAMKVHEAWEGSTLVSTKGLGHSMHQESVNQRIVEFLKS